MLSAQERLRRDVADRRETTIERLDLIPLGELAAVCAAIDREGPDLAGSLHLLDARLHAVEHAYAVHNAKRPRRGKQKHTLTDLQRTMAEIRKARSTARYWRDRGYKDPLVLDATPAIGESIIAEVVRPACAALASLALAGYPMSVE